MIKLTQGNLLRANAEALVNTVNCVGYMGKGIALQFKKAFPENFTAYHQACKKQLVVPGSMFVYEYGDMIQRRVIINFPTKRHWRNPSRMEDVESGLLALVEEVKARNIKSIAIPPLGCGLGGLNWSEVKPRIEAAFSELPDVEVLLYEPKGAPAPKDQPVSTSKPEMSHSQALMILLMARYHQFDYRLSLLEFHKLAYLLQEQGADLKLRYKAHHYGPYATNIRHLLFKMEGHFITGSGDDENPEREIELLPGAIEEAEAFLSGNEDARVWLEAVSRLIDGFETPYGMELLSSVLWVKNHENVSSAEDVMTKIRTWSKRKANMFTPFQVKAALSHLSQ
ncbi:type II toxin-antitoxin system antitoxin DNA ADP-ribosyl glycohydrolase DarG [Endozoicomonas numazuensis]|uniref:Appr-1-p processing protein n=1 Tax=Endozoicomonas numazuensis TaxID=1137799 RepID=A0A081NLN2_9GAMM|nr:macro domain-containing protein [Endozoicomonas numazuensis]KEQ19355.1 Appr-1-p processing protein [Endozoicomonas numazuensis]